MMTSLFSKNYYYMLLTSLDKFNICNNGYKTYEYLESNIRPIAQKYISLPNDRYKLVRVADIYTVNEKVNIWFVGYYNLNEIKVSPGIYLGKSICPSEDASVETIITDKLNLLFDSTGITLCSSKTTDVDAVDLSIETVSNYWGIILERIFEETDLNTISGKFKNSTIFGININTFLDYIALAKAYHLVKTVINGYESKGLGNYVTTNDIYSYYSKYFGTKTELFDFVNKVDKYMK